MKCFEIVERLEKDIFLIKPLRKDTFYLKSSDIYGREMKGFNLEPLPFYSVCTRTIRGMLYDILFQQKNCHLYFNMSSGVKCFNLLRSVIL